MRWKSHSPDVVLEHELAPGRCWRIRGSEGQITVRVASGLRINITATFIEQPLLGPKDDVEASPKSYSVWGLVTKDAHVETLRTMRAQPADWEDTPSGSMAPRNIPKDLTALRISHGIYNPYNGVTQQLTRTPDEVASLGIRVRGVIFMIHSNWGNPTSTCLYHIGINGNQLVA